MKNAKIVVPAISFGTLDARLRVIEKSADSPVARSFAGGDRHADKAVGAPWLRTKVSLSKAARIRLGESDDRW